MSDIKKNKNMDTVWSFSTCTSIQTSWKNWYLIFILFVQIIQGCIWKFPDSDLLSDSITDYSHVKEMMDCSMAIIRDEIANSLAFSNVFFMIGCLLLIYLNRYLTSLEVHELLKKVSLKSWQSILRILVADFLSTAQHFVQAYCSNLSKTFQHYFTKHSIIIKHN